MMDSIQWVIDQYIRRFKPGEHKGQPSNRNHYAKETKRLRLCPDCEHVWEIAHTGRCRRYNHLPTYGLSKKVCTFCKGLRGSYKDR